MLVLALSGRPDCKQFLMPRSFDAAQVARFGQDTPMGRMGQPSEVTPAFVFLASDEASYISGQLIQVNGGDIVNG